MLFRSEYRHIMACEARLGAKSEQPMAIMLSHNPTCLISPPEVVVVRSSVLSVNDSLQSEKRISNFGHQVSSKSGPRFWTARVE